MDAPNQQPNNTTIYARVQIGKGDSVEEQIRRVITFSEETDSEVVARYIDNEGDREQFA